jgi:hypothetical protein
MEAQRKKNRKREAVRGEAVRGERRLDSGEDVGNEAGALSWAAASQHWRIVHHCKRAQVLPIARAYRRNSGSDMSLKGKLKEEERG